MYKKSIVTTVVVLLTFTLASTVLANEPEIDTIKFEDYMLEVVDYTLPNGLRVILAEDHSAPIVAVNLLYRGGSANDPENRSGLATFLTHMMFEGSANLANDEFRQRMDAIGAKHNAYTNKGHTVYWAVLPANQLPLALWMESDRMASLTSTETAFDNQRKVVIGDYKQEIANKPYNEAQLYLFIQPFQGYPPYARSSFGTISDIEAATLAEVKAFHETYYIPNNATLAIVGDIDIEQTQALVQAYFADIPAGEPVVSFLEEYPMPDEFPVSRIDEETGCTFGLEEVMIDPQVELARLAGTVVTPARGEADFYALRLLADILGKGDSSRFEQNLIRQGLVATAFINQTDQLGTGLLYFGIYPHADESIEDGFDLVRAEFDKVIVDGVTPAELERVKQHQKLTAITSFRDSVRSTAEWLQDSTLNFDDPMAIVDEQALYEAVTPTDIQRVAQTYLCDAPLNTIVTLPEGDPVQADPIAPLVEPILITPSNTLVTETVVLSDSLLALLPEGAVTRTEPPTPLAVSESSLPAFETFTLDNGLELIFVEQTELPQIQLHLSIGGSNVSVEAEKYGVADIVAELLTKGTSTYTATQIAGLVEGVGGSMSANPALEWLTISANVPKTEAELVFDLLADVTRNPTFPEDELEVVREQTLTFLEQYEVDPDTLANRQFAKIAYGDHPYGTDITPETVTNMESGDLKTYHETYFKPNNALLVIVGDISATLALSHTERVFGDWEKGEVPDYLDYPPAELGDTSVIYLINHPDAEQATLLIGNQGINARNPDRYALTLVKTVLGTGSSRLFMNLREDKGYTNGIWSFLIQHNDSGPFYTVTDVGQDVAGLAITEILTELERIRTEPISESELASAKGLITGNYALGIENPTDFADKLATRYLRRVPLTEVNEYLLNIEAVTSAEAQLVANRYINTTELIIVVVGNAEILQPQLADIGEVVVIE